MAYTHTHFCIRSWSVASGLPGSFTENTRVRPAAIQYESREYQKIKAKKTAPQWLLRMEEVDFKYSNLRRECKIRWEERVVSFFFVSSFRKATSPLASLVSRSWQRAHGNNQNQVKKTTYPPAFVFGGVEHAPHLFTAACLLAHQQQQQTRDKVKHGVQTALWQTSHTPPRDPPHDDDDCKC